MRIVAVCLFLAGTLLCAESKSQLTVLLQFEGEPSSVSISALDAELESIMASSHLPLQLTVRTKPLAGSIPGDLVVFKMKGSCSMDNMPVGALSDERGPLAMTYLVDGDMLPFADIQCDRIRESVQRTLGKGNPQSHQTEYGAALARVMAHELYHMLSKSTIHQTSGLTKKGLSSRELTTGTMTLSDAAITAISPSRR